MKDSLLNLSNSRGRCVRIGLAVLLATVTVVTAGPEHIDSLDDVADKVEADEPQRTKQAEQDAEKKCRDIEQYSSADLRKCLDDILTEAAALRILILDARVRHDQIKKVRPEAIEAWHATRVYKDWVAARNAVDDAEETRSELRGQYDEKKAIVERAHVLLPIYGSHLGKVWDCDHEIGRLKARNKELGEVGGFGMFQVPEDIDRNNKRIKQLEAQRAKAFADLQDVLRGKGEDVPAVIGDAYGTYNRLREDAKALQTLEQDIKVAQAALNIAERNLNRNQEKWSTVPECKRVLELDAQRDAVLKELLEYEQRRLYLQKYSQRVVVCIRKRAAELKKPPGQPAPKQPSQPWPKVPVIKMPPMPPRPEDK